MDIYTVKFFSKAAATTAYLFRVQDISVQDQESSTAFLCS